MSIASVKVDDDIEMTSTPELAFSISDKETAAASLQVSASSSDKALLPDYNLVLGGSGGSRTIKATPLANQTGTAKITVTGRAGTGAATRLRCAPGADVGPAEIDQGTRGDHVFRHRKLRALLGLLLGAGVGVVLVLRWLWWRVTAWGEIAALVASALLVPASLVLLESNLARMLVVAAASTAAAVAASLWFAPASPAAMKDFYLRVRPPGAWGPVAALVGEDPRLPLRSLARGLGATILCCATVFGLLVGLGTWLVEATPPAWLPHRGAWIAVCLLVAVGAIPGWLRLGFRSG